MEKVINFTETEVAVDTSTDFFDLKILTDGKEPQTKKLKRDLDGVSVGCFVLLVENEELDNQDGAYNLDLLGNPMFQYVVRACPSVPSCLNYNETMGDVVNIIRPHLKDTEYSLVLFSDTPLITKSNILNILDFVKSKDLNVCKLTRGWVFKNEYIKRVKEIYAPTTYYFEEEDFLMAANFKQLQFITEVLKSRIVSYHMKNGVYFKDPDNTYLEANVSIGKGSVIEPFVTISKDTQIGRNVFIGAFSKLNNANILDNVKIEGACVDGGVLMNDVVVKSNAKILSQTAIKEGSVVGEDSVISNAIIGEYSMIGRNSIVNYLTTKERITVGDNCRVVGNDKAPVVFESGVSVGGAVTVMAGVAIKENKTIKYGETVTKEGAKND